MNAGTQRLSVWCGGGFMVMFFVGWPLAGFLPPPPPAENAQWVAEFFSAHRTQTRLGLFIMMLGCGFMCPWVAVISVQLKRIEGPHSPMAYAQMIAGSIGILIFVFPIMFWQAAAYRPERSAESIQLMSDLGWLILIGVTCTAMFQSLAIAAAILTDRGRVPVLPRWVGYFNVWVDVGFVPAAMVVFFHDAPFAWTGLLAFWLAVVVFVSWFAVMVPVLLAAIKVQERDWCVPDLADPPVGVSG